MFVRYRFPGKRIFDAVIDLPFALPTAVAGIALTTLYARNGWFGQFLEPAGLKVAFSPAGIVVALTFVGLPFVVRTLQPVLEDAERELEEAAAALGANRWQTVVRVILPGVLPAWLTGFALAFARGVGEYGSVIFIAGNLPGVSEIAPLLIVIKLEEYDYAGATLIAAAMLVVSFVLLLLINLLQARTRDAPENSMTDAKAARIAEIERMRREPLRPPRIERNAAISEPTLGAHRSDRRSRSLFLVVFLVSPLLAVFVEALRKGVDTYWAAIIEPDALAALALDAARSRGFGRRESHVRHRRRVGDREVRVPRQAAC